MSRFQSADVSSSLSLSLGPLSIQSILSFAATLTHKTSQAESYYNCLPEKIVQLRAMNNNDAAVLATVDPFRLAQP